MSQRKWFFELMTHHASSEPESSETTHVRSVAFAQVRHFKYSWSFSHFPLGLAAEAIFEDIYHGFFDFFSC
jgi:hypothetical protein